MTAFIALGYILAGAGVIAVYMFIIWYLADRVWAYIKDRKWSWWG